ncbi:MAG TPA: hypothetical protein PLC47_06965, partial [Bacteroidales bacterium]|nr:hypothetical protein [Bacteroidales bacterium]
ENVLKQKKTEVFRRTAVVSYSQITSLHNHIVNGVMVSHAHPYKHQDKVPVQNHDHRPVDFALLSFFKDFQHFTITAVSIEFAESITSIASKTIVEAVNPLPQNSSLFSFCFRGPPMS